MRIAAFIRSCLLVASAIPVCGAGQAVAQTAPSADNPAMYRGPDREQRLIEGARKAGKAVSDEPVDLIFDQYRQKQ